MSEIIIDYFNTGFLIKRLKELFNPYVITEKNETVLNFKNEIGEGTFTILTLDDDKLNIYFKGIFFEDTKISFYNLKHTASNFYYLQKGQLTIGHNNKNIVLEENNDQQLIYNTKGNDLEVMLWKKEVAVEFNYLKFFDLSDVNKKNQDGELISILKEKMNGNFIIANKSEEIDAESPLLHSDNVSENRIIELENNIRFLHDVQKNLILG